MKNQFSKREVQRAFRKFKDMANDVERSHWQSWHENLRLFMHHCQNDPVMKAVLEPLSDFPYGYWIERAVRNKHGTQRLGIFPEDEDDRTALYYQLLIKAIEAESTFSFVMQTHRMLYGNSDMRHASEFISVFNDDVFTKFSRVVGYHLEEIQENIEGQDEIERESLITFHVTTNFANYGTLVAGNITAENSNVAIGQSQIKEN